MLSELAGAAVSLASRRPSWTNQYPDSLDERAKGRFSGSCQEAVTHPGAGPVLYLSLAHSFVKARSPRTILARELRGSQSGRQVGRNLIGPRYADPTHLVLILKVKVAKSCPWFGTQTPALEPMPHRQLGNHAVAWPRERHSELRGKIPARDTEVFRLALAR